MDLYFSAGSGVGVPMIVHIELLNNWPCIPAKPGWSTLGPRRIRLASERRVGQEESPDRMPVFGWNHWHVEFCGQHPNSEAFWLLLTILHSILRLSYTRVCLRYHRTKRHTVCDTFVSTLLETKVSNHAIFPDVVFCSARVYLVGCDTSGST